MQEKPHVTHKVWEIFTQRKVGCGLVKLNAFQYISQISLDAVENRKLKDFFKSVFQEMERRGSSV
jgi:hypothetical protein